MKQLLDIQKKIKAIKKEEDNPFFHSKYFDINGLLAALKPVLNEVGVVVLQPIVMTESGINTLKTLVLNGEDGKVIVESSVALPTGLDPQKMGSAITYYRRYALQSLFLLESVDDDANSATPQKADVRGYTQNQVFAQPPAAPKASQGGNGNCKTCGSNMVMSPKTGKIFCEKKCWLNPPPISTPENDFNGDF
jgi:hypothetical protein